MIDFSLTGALAELQATTRRFIAEEVMPLENDPRQGPHGPEESLRRELVARGRKAGLLSSHMPH